MATDAKWVLSCKSCHAECTYAQIPGDTESYFLPKKPHVPGNFSYRCDNCGHKDTYQRNDLRYRDETMPSRTEQKNCGTGESRKP